MHINQLTIDELKSAYVQSTDSAASLDVIGMKSVAAKYKKQAKAIMKRLGELQPVKHMSDDELLAALAN